MATTTVKDAPAEAADAKGKSSPLKSKKFIIILVAVLAIGGGAYKFFLAPKPKPAPPTGGDIVQMDPTTLNLANGHYLQVAVAIQLVKGKATLTDFKSSQAAELVIDEFSNRSVASLSTNAARQKLTTELTEKVKKAYEGEVFAIYLTRFVTQ